MGFMVENKLADDAARRNVAAGYHYFDADTMKGFGSKLHEGYDAGESGTIVVMSNKSRSDYIVNGRRHYFIMRVAMDGRTHRVEGHEYNVSERSGYYLTLAGARGAARKVASAMFGKAVVS